MAKVIYTIDGVDIKEKYQVCVSGSNGILNQPKMKKPLSINNMNEHGVQVYLGRKYYESRKITLDCFISAKSKVEFIEKVVAFENIFRKVGNASKTPLNRLVISVDSKLDKPLIYEVYSQDELIVNKEWHDREMVGTFSLKLIEPEPLKRVLRATIKDPSIPFQIGIINHSYLNVYWGDGMVTNDVLSEKDELILEHQYGMEGDYYIVIYGDIKAIEKMNTNANIIWREL